MATPEGKGIARRTWDAYHEGVQRTVTPALSPLLTPAAAPVARSVVEDLVGFWVMWHLYGGFEGLVSFGFHPTTVWRKVKRFRVMTGQHPDEFEMTGVKIDAPAYWAAAGKKIGPHP
jgi:hypothetical protein